MLVSVLGSQAIVRDAACAVFANVSTIAIAIAHELLRHRAIASVSWDGGEPRSCSASGVPWTVAGGGIALGPIVVVTGASAAALECAAMHDASRLSLRKQSSRSLL